MTPVEVPAWLRTGAALAWRALFVVAGLLAVAWLFFELRIVTVPAVVALLVATVLSPLVQRLKGRGWKPILATWGVLGPAILLLVGGVTLLVPVLTDQFSDVGDKVEEGIDDIEQRLADDFGFAELDLRESAEQALDDVVQSGVSDEVVSGVTLLGEFLAGILLALVMVFFFLKDGDRICAWFAGHVPDSKRGAVRAAGNAAWRALGGYVKGTAVIGLVDGVVIGIGLAVIGVPLVVPLSILTFIGAFFPLIGATLAGAVAALVALVTGGVTDALLVIGVVIVVQQLEGDLLQPVVMGRTLKLHPLVILVAVTSGAVLAGILGAFLAVPAVAVTVVVVNALRYGDPDAALDPPGAPPDDGPGLGADEPAPAPTVT